VSLVPYLHIDAELTDAEVGTAVALDPDARHHLTRVLRLSVGADVEVSDGRGNAARAELVSDGAVLTSPVEAAPVPRPRLVVAQGLPRSRRFDEVVRQVTELGADRIVPVAAARSVTRLDAERAERAVERWTAIGRSAAEQSRRPWRPVVDPVVRAHDLVRALPAGTRLLVAHVGAELALPAALAAGDEPRRSRRPSSLAIAVGPEGGWDDDEVTAFVDGGATVVGLGATVLRTEHAAAAACAVLAAVTGRWS
jgi:16S rRNA (uracil1498-N3)-methyltransferase